MRNPTLTPKPAPKRDDYAGDLLTDFGWSVLVGLAVGVVAFSILLASGSYVPSWP